MFSNLKVNSYFRLLFKSPKLVSIGMILLISACAQHIDNNTSNSNNNDAALFEEPEILTIANPGTVPVFNGSRTSTFLVLDNFTNKTITNIQYQIDDSNHVDPLNPDTHTTLVNGSNVCSTLLPHSSCKIDYTGPLLSSGKLDATADQLLVKYQINGQTKTTSAVINYRVVYSDSSSNPSKILSMGSPNAMTGTNGTRSAMLYYYVSGKTPVSLKNAGFNSSSFNIINKNFTNDSSIAPGMILTYEVSADYNRNNVKNAAYSATNTAQFSLNYLNSSNGLQTTLTDVANNQLYISGPYIILSPISTIYSKAGSSQTFTVYNVGSQPANVTLSGSSNDFSLSNSSAVIAANSSQAFKITVNTAGTTNLNANITVAAANANSVNQQFTIIGAPNLLVLNLPTNITLENHIPQVTQITITNSPSSGGIIKLSNTNPIQIGSNNPNLVTTLTGGTCSPGESLPAGQSCNYQVTLSEASTSGSYNTRYNISANVSYSNSQNNYTDNVTSYSRTSSTTTMNTANILASDIRALSISGDNIDTESVIVTFSNSSTLAAGTVSDIQLANNPAYMTLSTSGVSNPCKIGIGQTNSLAPMQSCNVLVNLGPYSSSSLITGQALLNYSYVNYAAIGTQTSYKTINYTVTPQSLSFIIKSVSSNGATGDGSINSPYLLLGSQNNQSLTVTYQNTSNNQIQVESFSNNYGAPGSLGTYWIISDQCSGKTLASNDTCVVTYIQNFYKTAAQNNYNCNGTNQNMNITSPSVSVRSLLTQQVFNFTSLTYPNSLSTTLNANLSNIYILNNLSVSSNGSYAQNPNYNIYTSVMSSAITNASGYGAFNLISRIQLNSGFGGQITLPLDVSTSGLGVCSTVGPYVASALYSQTCSYSAGSISSGNLAESYTFYAQPYLSTNAWYYYQDVSLSGNSNQTYCMQNGSNYLQLN